MSVQNRQTPQIIQCYGPPRRPVPRPMPQPPRPQGQQGQEGAPISSAGDTYYMDGKQYDMESLLMALQMERAENLDAQLMDQANAIKKKNELLAQANAALVAARKAKNDKKATWEPAEYKNFIDNHYPEGRDNTGNDTFHNDKEWDININNLKTYIDTLNSDSQMDMVRMQSLMNKRNQSFELMTNSVSKLSKNKDSIISNIR